MKFEFIIRFFYICKHFALYYTYFLISIIGNCCISMRRDNKFHSFVGKSNIECSTKQRNLLHLRHSSNNYIIRTLFYYLIIEQFFIHVPCKLQSRKVHKYAVGGASKPLSLSYIIKY